MQYSRLTKLQCAAIKQVKLIGLETVNNATEEILHELDGFIVSTRLRIGIMSSLNRNIED